RQNRALLQCFRCLNQQSTTSVKTLTQLSICSVVIFAASNHAAATDLTWTGSVSSDWNNPTNWIPQQVPGASDHVVINSGSLAVPADAVFAIMDWTGGTINGALNVASNGVLNIGYGPENKILDGALTNAGTVVV